MAASIGMRVTTLKLNTINLCRAFSALSRTIRCCQKTEVKRPFVFRCSGFDKSRSYPSQYHVHQYQKLHTTTACYGLEEFFDDKKNWGEVEVKSGRAWELDELRIKDNTDLHKLWYVLLKEKNMLLTMKLEAKKKETYMPSPERLEKVETSMDRLMEVVKERNDAVRELRTGNKEEIPTRTSYNIFGEKITRKLREWPVPYHMNRKVQTQRHFYYPMTVKFIQMRKEIEANRERRRQMKIRKAKEYLRRKFPDAEID